MTKSNDTRTNNLGTLGLALRDAGLINDDGQVTMTENTEQEKERLVARVKDAKLPGYGTCQRWKIETLRKKVAGLDAADDGNDSTDAASAVASESVTTDDTTDNGTDTVETVAETVAETTEETPAEAPVAEASDETPAEAPVAEADPNVLTEVGDIVLGQIVPGKVVAKLPHALLVQLGENGPTAQLYKKQLSGGTHHNRKVRYDALNNGDELAVEVTKIRPPKEDDARKRYRIDVSEKTIQDRSVQEGITCGTAGSAGTVITGEIRQVHKDYVRICVTDGVATGYNALLHATEVNLPTRSDRDAFIANYNVGDKVSAEAIEVKTPKNQDILIGLSLAVSSSREVLSLAGSENEPGASVSCTVKSKKEFGAFVTIDEGPGAGKFGLIHISQMPGRYPSDREEFLASITPGQQFDAEVTKAVAKDDGRIEIGLSLVAEEFRARKAAYQALADDTESTHMATAVKSIDGGFLVEFSYAGGTFKGKLPSSDCPASLKRGERTRVKVQNVDGSRITLHRRGL